MFSNQEFCYWLQGYFEISRSINLNPEKLAFIKNKLQTIHEPLGDFTGWLLSVIEFLELHQCSQSTIDYFTPEIQLRLNLIFVHVIDTSYDVSLSAEALKNIHDGAAL